MNDAGKQLATMDPELFGGRGEGDVELIRGDLTRILQAATDPAIETIYADSITGIRQTGDGVDVTFAAGGSRRFDLVVGADGLHSGVRSLAFGDESPYLHHLGYDIAIFTVPNRLGLDRAEVTLATPGRTALVYSTGAGSDAKAMFLFASGPTGHDREDPEQQRRIVAEAFAGRGWEVPRLLEEMWAAPDFYFDSISQIRMDAGQRGESPSSVTPRMVRRPRPARERASRSPARTSSPGSSPTPTGTAPPPSDATRRPCAASSTGTSSWRPRTSRGWSWARLRRSDSSC